MPAYYNEHDANAAAWLRELIAQGHIAPGDVDERSITDVGPDDLAGYTQCHFFAGVGVWSHALRNAGWADDAPVWTGSCPCQPFSASGKRGGTDDQRHLWPAWFRLIRECQPNVCLGEQVASPDGLAWFDFVSADLEGAGYAVGAADLCAAGIGAPHIRQRLYFVAVTDQTRRGIVSAPRLRRGTSGHGTDGRGTAGELADADARGFGIDGRATGERDENERLAHANERSPVSRMGDTNRPNESAEGVQRGGQFGRAAEDAGSGAAGSLGNAELHGCAPDSLGRGASQSEAESRVQQREGSVARGFWSAADWIACRDGKARPVEPGTFPLAHGAPARVVRLRGYGNAIVAPQATAFIEAYRSLGRDLE